MVVEQVDFESPQGLVSTSNAAFDKLTTVLAYLVNVLDQLQRKVRIYFFYPRDLSLFSRMLVSISVSSLYQPSIVLL